MSPLANQNPLSQLNAIIEPSAASPWPPALIYWLLLGLFLLLLVVAVYLFKHLKKQQRKQKRALTKLHQLEAKNADFIKLNQLIKGTALSYFPRQQVASLHGEQWFDFLQTYSTTPLFNSRKEFIERLYRNNQVP
ncbi:MAG: DUF4381 domain-containing protein, partial [Psychromonas sp.]|nr:DUF4381 domain-containing protein [Psychromonas sp.]